MVAILVPVACCFHGLLVGLPIKYTLVCVGVGAPKDPKKPHAKFKELERMRVFPAAALVKTFPAPQKLYFWFAAATGWLVTNTSFVLYSFQEFH